MEKNTTISTPPPLNFPKITFTFCALPFKTQKKILHIPSLPSSHITQTLQTLKSNLNLFKGPRGWKEEKKNKLQLNLKPT